MQGVFLLVLRTRENTSLHSCNILPYCTVMRVIRYMYCSECTRSDDGQPDVEIAEVGETAPMYADPSAIDRQEFPGTHDVYTVVDKTKKTHKPEDHLPTYQVRRVLRSGSKISLPGVNRPLHVHVCTPPPSHYGPSINYVKHRVVHDHRCKVLLWSRG